MGSFHLVLALNLVVSLITLVDANECTAVCDNGITIPSDTPIRLCGTDKLTHYSSFEAAVSSYCYFNCNVGALFQGTCGCPNDCFEESGHGSCVNSQCECKQGIWGGLDCGSPGPKNSCSEHGKITQVDKMNQCVCDPGFTGVDCSTKVFELGNLPWGNVFESKVPYSSADLYNDSHPVWDISQVATLRIEIDDASLVRLLTPDRIAKDAPSGEATLYFQNGAVQEKFMKVGVKPTGEWSRMDLKKDWSINLGEFVSGQKLLGTKSLSLKAGSGSGGEGLLKQVLATDFYRAVGLPVQRTSFATLFINDVYMGVYLMQEDLDENFVQNHIEGDTGSGNMMKMHHDAHMRSLGAKADQEVYEKAHGYFPSGDIQYNYEQSFGNGNWSDFIDLLSFIETSSDGEFLRSIGHHVDVNQFIKSLMVENFILSSGTYQRGENYQLYHQTSGPWLLLQHDFDSILQFTSELGVPAGIAKESAGVLSFHLREADDPLYNPLTSRVLSIYSLRRLYIELYIQFISTTFTMAISGDTSKQDPAARYAALYEFIEPWVRQDKLMQISSGVSPQKFKEAAHWTSLNLPQRYKIVTDELLVAAAEL